MALPRNTVKCFALTSLDLQTLHVDTREDSRMISSGTTGLRTWQAGVSLANHLIAAPRTLAPYCHVLELGAGCGLVSQDTPPLRVSM